MGSGVLGGSGSGSGSSSGVLPFLPDLLRLADGAAQNRLTVNVSSFKSDNLSYHALKYSCLIS